MTVPRASSPRWRAGGATGRHAWRVLVAELLLLSPLDAQIVDPVPAVITKSGLSVTLEEVVRIPASAESPPLARINQLRQAADGTDRLFVNDLRGRLYIVDGGSITTYLDLGAETPGFVDRPGLGGGFGSFAFHPDFASNGLLYTVHTEALGGRRPDLVGPTTVEPVVHGVISEWHSAAPLAGVFSGTRREVLRIEFPGTIHGIQEISFNPRSGPGSDDYGLLYVGVGDGGSVLAGLPNNSRRLDSPLGTILRIAPSRRDGPTGAYGIPADNPWASDPDPAILGEIWAYGFRNPHRFSWDQGGVGVLLIGEIGESNVEEINLGRAGGDYGWPIREGPFALDPEEPATLLPLPADDARLGFTYPAATYDRDDGNAVVGGFVYRGRAVEALRGQYVFGDIPTGRIFHFDVADLARGGPVTISELTLTTTEGVETSLSALVERNRVDLRFGLDREGELYVLTKADGVVRRVGAAPVAISIRPTLAGEFGRDWLSDGSGDWILSEESLVLKTAGTPSGLIRRPASVALLKNHLFGDVVIEGELRSSADPSVTRADLLLLFGYQSPTRFYYVHLSGITDGVHNGIFVVDDEDRRRIDDGSAAPQLADREWHHVRLERDPSSGRIAVFVDGADEPALVATDHTFASGAIGFGSFDDTGAFRRIVIRGEAPPVRVPQ